MLKIGEFADLFNITIKTVRFYESKHLFKPFYIDKYTGYRYYNDKNIDEMSRILYLKNLGFSLDEIKNYDETRLKEKIDEFKKQITKLQKNINILETLDNIKKEEIKAFVNDEKVVGKWNLIGISNTKEDAKNNLFENNISNDIYDIKNLYLLENGKQYWIISWSKGDIYINGQENPYEVEDNRMYVNIVYPDDKSTYIIAVYERENDKKYTIDEIRKKDRFNGYYKQDSKLIGFWRTIDYIKKGQRFNYRIKRTKEFPILERMTVNPVDNSIVIYMKEKKPILTKYTKNYIINMAAPDTMSNYTYKRINGREYIIVEWKTEDYIFGRKIDGYYVLEKVGGNYMEDMFERKERIYSILSSEKNGLLLGKDIYLPAGKRGNVNALVVGGSGAGKSASYSKPNIFNMLGSYIIVDTWNDIYDTTYKYLEENGYKIITVNNEKSKYNYNYNPLNHIKDDYDIDVLTDILMGDEKDEFWNNASKCLMKTILYYVLEKEDKKDLLTCFKLIGLTQEKLFEKFENFDSDSKASKYYSILKTFPEKTYSSVVSTAIMKLSFVINLIPEDRNYEQKFNFTDLTDNKIAIYLNDNETSNDDRKLINIFIAQFLSQIKIDNIGNEVIYLFLDKIDKLGEIENLSRNVETARARKISISLMTSNLNKLKNIYGDEFYTIINSIDTQLLLGTNLKFDIEYFSDILGLDDEFIKNDLERDKLLIAEKGLKPILADKDYFYRNTDWIKYLEQ